ncbi:hypothetical protein HII13_000936 [Brettanomyces bruxellensis]|uniref:DEBR0S1_31934g1_1 n=1 Tax=Dekkera bruxellensis TaxID=5007 RepID=A0A7D9H2U7_DEKBR|nr:60s ribosomal protein l7 [Brettanomyces bruxellensis AWRI1499]KAF6013689.1 hypothetical protein HII13_000936 [Brettanomyces bruxellensis]KAF6015979.1 hypothetical protein HII12_000542 [Brettanomyces bruxellensis]VUG17045.1 RLP7 [Brettanomyces bruxellensis]
MSSEETPLTTNPEIVLRKRKNALRLREVKKLQAGERAAKRLARKNSKNQKFIRAETMIARHRASEREQYRIKRVTKYDRESIERSDKKDDDENSKLVFIMRIKGPYGARIPYKAIQILRLLRLDAVNVGTFAKYNETIRPLLRIVNPYIVIGTPSLATVRNLIQKRARVRISVSEMKTKTEKGEIEEGEEYDEARETVSVPLNDNNLIEEKLGENGIICTEDIIHEIASVGPSFKTCVKFMEPFKLEPPVNGWNAFSKLERIEYDEEMKNHRVNNSARAPLNEVDVDKFIANQI